MRALLFCHVPRGSFSDERVGRSRRSRGSSGPRAAFPPTCHVARGTVRHQAFDKSLAAPSRHGVHCGPCRLTVSSSKLALGRGGAATSERHSHTASQEGLVARVIAIANQKGGVGKTTTAVNLAASLAVAERRTLLIDGDPQGNATSGTGIEPGSFEETSYDVLLGTAEIASARVRGVQFQHLDVLPATPDLAGAEVELVDTTDREQRMRLAVQAVRSQYDFILIDCPPSLGLITLNMLAAA